MSRVKLAAGAAVLIATVTAAVSLTGPSPIPADLFLSPSGSDSAPCTKDAPCKTLAHALAVAQPGFSVGLADGYYGCGTLSRSLTADVTFQPDNTGATPWVTCPLPLGGQHIVLKDINVAGLDATGSDLVTLRNVNVTCKDEAPFALFGGRCSAGIFGTPTNFLMQGGSVGPTVEGNGSRGNSQFGIPYSGGTAIAKNAVFDGVRFHDNRRSANTEHTECIMLGGGDSVTIRNSTFENCAVFDIFNTWWSFTAKPYTPAVNTLLENNTFGQTVGGCPTCDPGFFAVQFASYPPTWSNVTIRGNSFGQSLNVEGNPANFLVTGNRGSQLSYACKAGVTYSFNVWDGGVKCGATDGSSGGTTTTTPTTTAATTTAPVTTAPVTTAPTTTVAPPPTTTAPPPPTAGQVATGYLKATTISYPDWLHKSYGPGVRETTNWAKALAVLNP